MDEVFGSLVKVTGIEAAKEEFTGPSFEEVNDLIRKINIKKSVTGNMSGDLMKLGGDSIARMVHRCIYTCCIKEEIPDQMKIEKIVLLYKNSGEISDMDNYRGIFLRYLILSLMQKWMYKKCAPTVDINGTEYAFGGRTKRSVRELLLVVKLIQDHAKWTKRPLVMKFLDIRKFFDTMNYKTALIEAYKSGIKGNYWRIYKSINEIKKCTPYTPLGECGEIDVKEVFVQGSSDAMLMAWNLVDGLNKKECDSFDPICCVEGVEIRRLGFVDDLLELARGILETQISCISDEIFEKQNCLLYKPSKCKVMLQNLVESGDVILDGEILEIVKEHKYLGTIVESSGGRAKDVQKRISDCKGVLNEIQIVELCKTEAVGSYRFKYMSTLLNSCFLKKFEHGCEVWGVLTKKDILMINRLLPQTIKRVLELPRSTPTNAVKHDFGVVDLTNEVELERVLLAVNVLGMSDERIAKRLLNPMLTKEVPGYCSQLTVILQKYQLSLSDLVDVTKAREICKEKIVRYEKIMLQQSMMTASKTDAILLNFAFDGKMMKYLQELPFLEGRIIFMFRCRMFPTRVNFPERWSSELKCIFCSCLDTDEHLFSCMGYLDIMEEQQINPNMFYTLDAPMTVLSRGAKILLMIYERLERFQEDSDLV